MTYVSPVYSNPKKIIKFSPFSMELPQPGAVTSMFNTVSPTSKLSPTRVDPAFSGLAAHTGSSDSVTSMLG